MGNFKKLLIWQESMSMVKEIYLLTNKDLFSKDFALRDQIRKSSYSIPSNIAEGDESGSNKQSIRYFKIANGSAAELITQRNIAAIIGYISNEELEILEKKKKKISFMIRKVIKSRELNN